MDFLDEELEEILNIFREESEEQIQKINQNLLKLEENPNNKDAIAELFREAHSIKGAARMIGLNDIQNVAHNMEDVFGLAKDNEIPVNPKIIDVLCKAIDCISSIIDESIETKGISHSPLVDEIVSQLETIVSSKGQVVASESEIKEGTDEISEEIDLEEGKTFIQKINSILPEVYKCLRALSKNSRDAVEVSKLQKLITNIDSVSQNIKHEKLVENISNLKIKLDWIVKGSGILLDAELIDVIEFANNFINALEEFAQQFEMEIIAPSQLKENDIDDETEEIKFEQVEDKVNLESERDVVEGAPIKLIQQCIDNISNNIINVDNSKEGIEIIDLVLENIESLKGLTDIKEVLQIYDQIAEIFVKSKNSSEKPDKDFLEVIRQSAESAGEILVSPDADSLEDPNLIMQRLSILVEMIEISNNDMTFNNPNSEDVEYSIANKNTEIVLKEASTDKTQEQYTFSEPGAIKTLRVDTRKLDQLVNQVGELIIAKIKTKQHLSEIERISKSIEEWYRDWGKSKHYLKYMDRKGLMDKSGIDASSTTQKNIYSLFEYCTEKITNYMNEMNTLYRTVQEDDARLNLIVNELEQMVKGVRVLPLATVFHMFPRMVRDISRNKGKQVELVIAGSETSADKKIIEEIKSPLTHIIRNAIDHGIETPEVRIEKGKSPTGKIFLSAHHLENSVRIDIVDDGRGIDIEKIKNKVLQKGLLSHTELDAMTENQIMNIIFWPGFSTGDSVTDISGRGIGLDVVHTKINQLNGKVDITSAINEGCKVSILLPVTMATIKSFLVSLSNQIFAIPASTIYNAFVIKPDDVFLKEGKECIIYDGRSVPLFKLANILNMQEESGADDKQIVLIIQSADSQIGLIINKLIGEHEILHKNLSAPLIRVRNIAGVTALGSGELCLILNINDIIKSAYANRELLTVSGVEHIDHDEVDNSTKKILVVDDSVTTRILERNILRAAGYQVEVANHGLDALTKMAAEHYDLVVSDVEMPEVNGIELVQRIKSEDMYKHIPVILVTSLAKEEDKKKGMDVGASAYIVKGTFNQHELLSSVKQLLK